MLKLGYVIPSISTILFFYFVIIIYFVTSFVTKQANDNGETVVSVTTERCLGLASICCFYFSVGVSTDDLNSNEYTSTYRSTGSCSKRF